MGFERHSFLHISTFVTRFALCKASHPFLQLKQEGDVWLHFTGEETGSESRWLSKAMYLARDKNLGFWIQKDLLLVLQIHKHFIDAKVCVLLPFKARQVHCICADRKIFTETFGCLPCLYSWVGELCMLQAACLSACLMSWPLLPSMAPISAPVPLRVSHHHHPQQGVLTCLITRGE